jgi:hypothetical protein
MTTDRPYTDDVPSDLPGLLAALREDVLTDEQGHRLEQLLRDSDEALRTYIRAVAMQADLCGRLVRWAAGPIGGPGINGMGRHHDQGGAGTSAADRFEPRDRFYARPSQPRDAAEACEFDDAGGFDQTLFGRAVFETASMPHEDDEGEALTPPPSPPRVAEARDSFWTGPGASRRIGVAAAVAAMAAVVVIAVGMWMRSGSDVAPTAPVVVAVSPPSPTATVPVVIVPATAPAVELPPAPPPLPPIVATVSASVDALWDGGVGAVGTDGPVKLGASLRAGREVELVRGYARLNFGTGVEVILEAPTRLSLDAENRVVLRSGRLTAKVPGNAKGFTVGTGVIDVVDLGTEFGVNVAPDGTVDVPVFTGEVQARPAEIAGASATTTTNAAPPPPVVSLRAGQSGRIDESGLKVAKAGREAAAYVRDIRKIRTRLAVHGTGEGLSLGDPDPRWQITAVSTDPDWTPRPAVVCGPGPYGVANDQQSGWVSTTGERPSLPGGVYTFKTTFDVARHDPKTTRLRLRLGGDNFIRRVHLNGQPTGIKLELPGNQAKERLHDFDVSEGFRPGQNELEIFVENTPGLGTKDRPNAMVLRAELHGTAVHLLDEK